MADLKLSVYPVQDVAQAQQVFTTLLGVEPYIAKPYYVGYRVGDYEIGLDPRGGQNGTTGPINYWDVPDIQQTLQTLLDAGAEAAEGIRDVGGGLLVATVRVGTGNTIGLRQIPSNS